jgi:heme oxygenase
MITTASARMSLRDATSQHHQRVDAAFSSVTLSDRESYARFLLAQAAAHIPAEHALERGGIAAVIPDWPTRRRSAALEADLAEVGESIPRPIGDLVLDGEAALLGALYVLEGSRLGGTVLKRALPAGFPARFLGGVDSAAWRSLLERLDARLHDDADLQRAITAAGDVFALFETAGRRYLEAA